MTDQPSTFDAWAVVELLGHRRIAGRVTEVMLAGGPMLKLTEVDPAGGDGQEHYFGRASIYALHPTTEMVVRKLSAGLHWAPASRYELEAGPASFDADEDPWGDAHDRGVSALDDEDVDDDEDDAPGVPITMTPDGPRLDYATVLVDEVRRFIGAELGVSHPAQAFDGGVDHA